MTFTDNEPLITGAGLSALAVALITLAVVFGVPITDQQKEAIVAVVGLIAPFAVAYLVRPHVTPTLKAEAQVMQALANGSEATIKATQELQGG